MMIDPDQFAAEEAIFGAHEDERVCRPSAFGAHSDYGMYVVRSKTGGFAVVQKVNGYIVTETAGYETAHNCAAALNACAVVPLLTNLARYQNSVDVFEQIATNAGFGIEPESFAAARDYVNQEVSS